MRHSQHWRNDIFFLDPSEILSNNERPEPRVLTYANKQNYRHPGVERAVVNGSVKKICETLAVYDFLPVYSLPEHYHCDSSWLYTTESIEEPCPDVHDLI